MINICILLSLILIGAEALYDSRIHFIKMNTNNIRKEYEMQRHFLKTVIIGSILTIIYVIMQLFSSDDFIRIALSYILLRFALFDSTFNYLIGEDILYLGNSSSYDLLLKKIIKFFNNNQLVLLVVKLICIILSLIILNGLL